MNVKQGQVKPALVKLLKAKVRDEKAAHEEEGVNRRPAVAD